MKLGVIGVGNMGGAILMGSLKEAAVSSKDLLIYNRSLEKLDPFVELGVPVAKDVKEVLEYADLLLIAVKPQNFKELAETIRPNLKESTTIISIAAGISLSKMEEYFGKRKFIRVMPNTPALIGQAVSAVCKNDLVEDNEFFAVMDIFNAIGEAVEVEEEMMGAFAGICGCMPAYVYMFIEAAADAAVKNGIKRDEAYRFIAKTVAGSANMLIETGKHPGQLKDEVTSPAGTTIRGVLALEREGFRNAIIKAVDESSNYKIENI